MNKKDIKKWINWLTSELSDYDKRHGLGKYQIMADLPPCNCFLESKLAKEKAETLNKEAMKDFLASLCRYIDQMPFGKEVRDVELQKQLEQFKKERGINGKDIRQELEEMINGQAT